MSKTRLLAAGLALAIGSAPATADYLEFTGTIRFADPSPNGSGRLLPEGVSLSGSGVADSVNAPPLRRVRDFAGVKGFTGALTTDFASTGGYTQMAFLSGLGPGSFTTNTGAPPGSRLHGKMAVRGLAELLVNRDRTAAFPLTTARKTGLGLGGTLKAISGDETAVRFGAWTTRTVSETMVIVESHPIHGVSSPVYGAVTGMGFDTRTEMGMGTVQFVTPIRTVATPLLCWPQLPPCDPVPGDHGAVAVLTLHFAPEPARGLALLAACVALALLGTSRRRAGVRR